MTAIAQQVDLLIDDLKPRREPLRARHAAALLAVTMLGLAATSGAQTFAVRALDAKRTELETQLTQLARATTALEQTIRPAADPELAARVDAARLERSRRQALLDFIATSMTEHTAGFSGYLVELAEGHDAGLWLTAIEIRAGSDVALEGRTLEAAAVPRLLRRLTGGERFAGRRFGAFELAPDPATGALTFRIERAAEVGS